MTTDDFIIDLFCRVDEQMRHVSNHSQATLRPSEVVTIGLLFAIKGVGQRAFYRWLSRDYAGWFPALPERTPPVPPPEDALGMGADIPRQAQPTGCHRQLWRRVDPPGAPGSQPQGIGRARHLQPPMDCRRQELCLAVNHLGQIIGWVWVPANAHDTRYHPLIEVFKDRCVILGDTGFHAQVGDPPNLKLCQRGKWNDRMVVETIYSMLTVVCHAKKMRHRLADYLQAHLALMVAAFNVLIGWFGLPAQQDGFVPLSIAEFNL